MSRFSVSCCRISAAATVVRCVSVTIISACITITVAATPPQIFLWTSDDSLTCVDGGSGSGHVWSGVCQSSDGG